MTGTVVFVQTKSGKGGTYTRVGVVPEGKKDAVFFNVDGALDLQKGAHVEFDPEARTVKPLNGQEKAPLARSGDPRPYINRSVALQCATQLLSAEIQAGLVPMEKAEEALVNLARRLETYLNAG